MRGFLFLVAVFLVVAGSFAAGHSQDGRSIEIIHPKDTINLTQGETSEIHVNIKNTGDLTIANLNVSLETPEGGYSDHGLVKFLYMGVNETVTLKITPVTSAHGEYDLNLRLFSTLSGLDESRPVKVRVLGEKPPDVPSPKNETVLKSEADEMISRARGSIQKALNAGLDVTSASNVFSRAIESYNEGNYTEAIQLAELARQNSENLIAVGKPPKEEWSFEFDYTLILLLLVFIIIIIGVNKYLI